MARFEASEGTSGGLREVRFRLEVADENVPGRLWLPAGETAAARPLVLLQHPGMSGKDDAIVAAPARA